MKSQWKLVVVLAGTLVLAGTTRPSSAAWPVGGRALCTAAGDQLGPTIVSDGAGGAIVTWHDRRDSPFNIDVQHVLASGEVDAAWPANGRALLTDQLAHSIVPQGKEFPSIASDGAGGAIVAWPDARNAISGLDLFAHHVLSTGALDPAWPVNGAKVCSANGEQGTPVVTPDGAGGVFVAWVDARAGSNVGDLDVFAQHVLATGVVDPAWPANGVAVSTAPAAQFGPAIVGSGSGAILTWTDARSGNPGDDVYAQRVLRTGVVDPAWPVNGRALSAAPRTQIGPRIISDGGSGAFVAWTDDRDGTNHIYAQHVLSSGLIAAGWAANGQPVSVTGQDEVSPVLASDGATGAIVAWGDATGGHRNLRARHLLASGALDPAWPAAGVALSVADTDEVNQVIASDGAGGAIVAWQRAFDIVAQHVLASGAIDPAYPARGRAVCRFPRLQHEPDIVAAGTNGAIVTWMDTRDGLHDIYALQVLEAAIVGVPDRTEQEGIALARPNPNPARGRIALHFDLPRESSVRLAIYDAGGRRVRELASGTQGPGAHSVSWDLRDEAGHAVAAGLYFAQLEAEGRVVVRRFSALK